MTLQNSGNGSSLDSRPWKPASVAEREVLQEEAFKRMIAVERKRTERSAKPFLLMLLETGEHQSGRKERQTSSPMSYPPCCQPQGKPMSSAGTRTSRRWG